MKKLIIKLVLVLVVGVLGYNYFYGTDEEKANAKQIVGQVKQLTGSVANLLKSEKDKYDQGKYDAAIAKLKSALKTMHDKVAEMGSGEEALLHDVEDLEQQEAELETQLETLDPRDAAAAQAIREKILILNQRTETLINRLDR